MLALNRPATRRKLDICLARVQEPEISVLVLSERFDVTEAAVYAALKWGNQLGYFSEDAKAKIAGLDAQRTERARYYYQQLRYIRRLRRTAKRDLKRFLEKVPVPDEAEAIDAHYRTLERLEKACLGFAREEATYEAMIQKLEDSMAMLAGLVDAVEQPLPRAVKVVLVSAGNNGHGTS